jgi:hypothetical protein
VRIAGAAFVVVLRVRALAINITIWGNFEHFSAEPIIMHKMRHGFHPNRQHFQKNINET